MKPRSWSALALALVVVAWSIGDKERGNRLYRAGDYAGAAAAYEKAVKGGEDSPELHYNYATTLLRLGRYADAEQHFKAALKNVEPDLRERTLYNLGNRFLYQARSQPASGGAAPGPATASGNAATGAAVAPDQRALLDAAIKAYQEALRIDPKDGFAKWNLELALKDRQQKGGGGAQQKKGGGGGGSQQKNPNPQSNQNNSPRPQMSEAQADRILSAAENDERQLYKDKVRQGNREVPVTRDW